MYYFCLRAATPQNYIGRRGLGFFWCLPQHNLWELWAWQDCPPQHNLLELRAGQEENARQTTWTLVEGGLGRMAWFKIVKEESQTKTKTWSGGTWLKTVPKEELLRAASAFPLCFKSHSIRDLLQSLSSWYSVTIFAEIKDNIFKSFVLDGKKVYFLTLKDRG